MNDSILFGLILAGGGSTRMGIDKGLLPFHGKPQREHLYSLLRAFCQDVYLSCRSKEGIPPALQPLEDVFEIGSPLSGILTALTTFRGMAWLTVPVDMPNIDQRTIEFLVANRDRAARATCFYDSDGNLPEPLFTIWEPSALPLLVDFQKAGGHSPRSFLVAHEVKIVRPPDPTVLVNVNTPREWETWKSRHERLA